jgi:hypothetical protein
MNKQKIQQEEIAKKWLLNYFSQIKKQMTMYGWTQIRATQIWNYWKNKTWEEAVKVFYENDILTKNPNYILFKFD